MLVFALGAVAVAVGTARSSGPPTNIEKAGAKRIKAPGDWLAAGYGAVWLSDPPVQLIRRLDPRSGKVVAKIRIPQEPCVLLTRIDRRTNRVVERYGPRSGSGAAIVGFGAVWISAHDILTVWRLPLPKR